MQYCVDHPEEINKLAKVQAQVSEVKNVMMENIEKVHLYSLWNFLKFLI
jgi:vesicle-associated membrane protein 72